MDAARRLGRAICLGAIAHLCYSWVVRPWHLRWGATDEEVLRSMPGDGIVTHPTLAATRAVSVCAAPTEVWPWLVQMGGYSRAGWYSYDRIDNAGVPSADRIVPELQRLEVGDILPTGRDFGFEVEAIDPNRSLVLAIRHEDAVISSVFELVPDGPGRCRLVVRLRSYLPRRPATLAFAALFDPGDFVMMRKMMLGIKRRAEAGVRA